MSKIDTPRTRFRTLLVTTHTEVNIERSGVDVTPEALVAQCRAGFAQFMSEHGNPRLTQGAESIEEHAASFEDQIVWEGGRALALLRPLPDGSDLDVTWLTPTETES